MGEFILIFLFKLISSGLDVSFFMRFISALKTMTILTEWGRYIDCVGSDPLQGQVVIILRRQFSQWVCHSSQFHKQLTKWISDMAEINIIEINLSVAEPFGDTFEIYDLFAGLISILPYGWQNVLFYLWINLVPIQIIDFL